MKELVIVSGKGGTGKTSISAALAMLAPHKVLADCDVDAANLHLVVGSVLRSSHPFTCGFEPVTDLTACVRCGVCTRLCRFAAIENGVITNPLACEGCGVCAFNCPKKAISLKEKAAGHWMVSDTRFGTLVHASLGLSVENSGKLVSKVREKARILAKTEGAPLIITDGPPGIGCPVIASLTGASLVLAVVEPSVSGLHDLQRVVELARHFRLPVVTCINKATLNHANSTAIRAWCGGLGIPVVGEIPYDAAFRAATQAGQTVLETCSATVAEPVISLWNQLALLLDIAPASRT